MLLQQSPSSLLVLFGPKSFPRLQLARDADPSLRHAAVFRALEKHLSDYVHARFIREGGQHPAELITLDVWEDVGERIERLVEGSCFGVGFGGGGDGGGGSAPEDGGFSFGGEEGQH